MECAVSKSLDKWEVHHYRSVRGWSLKETAGVCTRRVLGGFGFLEKRTFLIGGGLDNIILELDIYESISEGMRTMESLC